MFSDIFGIKPKKGKANDALTEFINNILSNNSASVTIKINSAKSQNQRDVNGNMVSEEMGTSYPDRTQEILRDLGMAQMGITPGMQAPLMQQLLGGMQQPAGHGAMQTDMLAQMLQNPQAQPSMPYNASQIPLQQLLQMAGGMSAMRSPQPAPPQGGPDISALLAGMAPMPTQPDFGTAGMEQNPAMVAQLAGQQLPAPSGGLMGGEEPVDQAALRQLLSAFK